MAGSTSVTQLLSSTRSHVWAMFSSVNLLGAQGVTVGTMAVGGVPVVWILQTERRSLPKR